MTVYLSAKAENKLQDLLSYLTSKWNVQVKNDFLSTFEEKVFQVSLYPESCPQSENFIGLYKCVVSKQTSFYYRINYKSDEIEIITIFDTRQNPSRFPLEL